MDKEIPKDVTLNSESDNELEIVSENISNYGNNSTLVEVPLEEQEKIRISLEKGGSLPGKIKAIKVYAIRGNNHDMGSVRARLNHDMGSVRARLNHDMGSVKARLDHDLGSVKARLDHDLGSVRARLNHDMGSVKARFQPCNGQPSQSINVGSPINALFSNVGFPNQVQDIENNNSRLNKTDRTPEELSQVQNSSEPTLNRSQQDDSYSRETILYNLKVNSVMLSPMEFSSDETDDDAFVDDTILAFCDSSVPSPPVTGDSNGEKESSHTTAENVNSMMLSPMELSTSSDETEDDEFADDSILAFCDSPVPPLPVTGDSNEEKESSHTTAEKTDQSKMGKDGEVVAIKYRKVVRSKKASKFQLITSNVYPSCDCQGTKNGCKTNACTCIRVLQECQPTCGCMDNCPNMDLTRGEGKRIRIGASEVHGEGCFMEEDVKKGEFIGEYTGEIVAREEQDGKKKPSLFLFEIGEKHFLLDASRFGSELAKMNHRMKGANCEFKLKRVGGLNRVGVWALKDIGGGQELFASYGDTYRGHGLITPYLSQSVLSDVN